MISELIASGTAWINTISGGNQMIAGALTLSISGGLVMFARSLPTTIMAFLKVQFTTTLTFNNTTYQGRETYMKVSKFISDKCTQRGSRTLAIDTQDTYNRETERHHRSVVVTLGFGIHWVFYRGRILIMKKEALDSAGSELLKEQIRITVIGRSHNIFHELVEDNKPEDRSHLTAIYKFKEGWDIDTYIETGGLDTLALSEEVKKMFRDEMDSFMSGRERYLQIGLPHKITMILHGVAGSGKTSIIRALASEYKLNICPINISVMNDQSFPEAVSKAPKKSIVILEDFDSAGAVKTRKNVTQVAGEKKKGSVTELKSELDTVFGLSTSAVLNTLDGICSLDGSVIIMTTNCIDSIDPAVMRKGRVDKVLELPMLTPEVVREHFMKIYPDMRDLSVWPELAASQVNAVKMDGKFCEKDIAKALRKCIR